MMSDPVETLRGHLDSWHGRQRWNFRNPKHSIGQCKVAADSLGSFLRSRGHPAEWVLGEHPEHGLHAVVRVGEHVVDPTASQFSFDEVQPWKDWSKEFHLIQTYPCEPNARKHIVRNLDALDYDWEDMSEHELRQSGYTREDLDYYADFTPNPQYNKHRFKAWLQKRQQYTYHGQHPNGLHQWRHNATQRITYSETNTPPGSQPKGPDTPLGNSWSNIHPKRIDPEWHPDGDKKFLSMVNEGRIQLHHGAAGIQHIDAGILPVLAELTERGYHTHSSNLSTQGSELSRDPYIAFKNLHPELVQQIHQHLAQNAPQGWEPRTHPNNQQVGLYRKTPRSSDPMHPGGIPIDERIEADKAFMGALRNALRQSPGTLQKAQQDIHPSWHTLVPKPHPAVDLSRATGFKDLHEVGAGESLLSENMRVATMPEGTLAFVKRNEKNPHWIEPAVRGAKALEMLGVKVPQHHWNPHSCEQVSEGIKGVSLWRARHVDREAALHAAACRTLIGDWDGHSANWLVHEDGTPYPIDLDMAGGGKTPSIMSTGDPHETVYQRGLGHIEDAFGEHFTMDELMNHARKVATSPQYGEMRRQFYPSNPTLDHIRWRVLE